MYADDLMRLLNKQPFRPFRLHLSNGKSHDIRHPELIGVQPSIAWIHQPASVLPLVLAERSIFVVLAHVVWGEFIDAPAKLGGNGASG